MASVANLGVGSDANPSRGGTVLSALGLVLRSRTPVWEEPD